MSDITAKLTRARKKIYANIRASFANFYATSKKIISYKAVHMEQEHDPQQKAEDATPRMLLENVPPDPTEQSTGNELKCNSSDLI